MLPENGVQRRPSLLLYYQPPTHSTLATGTVLTLPTSDSVVMLCPLLGSHFVSRFSFRAPPHLAHCSASEWRKYSTLFDGLSLSNRTCDSFSQGESLDPSSVVKHIFKTNSHKMFEAEKSLRCDVQKYSSRF